ncbi:signal recognition particle, SRP19 subunit [Ramicandelaber brevisporus]|nr:signal recognition particle, SRP19 subunit [Ramicandelaber brevisporus]
MSASVEDYDEVDDLDFPLPEYAPSGIAPLLTPTGAGAGVGAGGLPGFFGNSSSAAAAAAAARFAGADPGTMVVSDERVQKQFQRWPILYPLYFDADYSCEDGRRMPLNLSVSKPRARAISMCLRKLGIPAAFEVDKIHPRSFNNPGRVRYNLFKGYDDPEYQASLSKQSKVPMVPGITNKKQLMRRVGELLPDIQKEAIKMEEDLKKEQAARMEKERQAAAQMMKGNPMASAMLNNPMAAMMGLGPPPSAAAAAALPSSSETTTTTTTTAAATDGKSGGGSNKKKNKKKK